MKILVTGGAGFIGSHLIKTLDEKGHDVIVVDNLSSGKRENVPDQISFVEGDIRNMDKLNLPDKIDVIFHLAAQIDVRKSVEDPDFNNEVNVEGTKKVVNFGVKAGMKKLVFSSTGGAIYGPTDIIPTPEDVECNSSSPYGSSKFEAEQAIQSSAKQNGFAPVILRYSNVYGPGQDGSKESGVIAIFINKAKNKQPMTIFGDGTITRDWVFVGDVVNANLQVLESDIEGTFNIATGVETSVNQLADLIKEIVPYEIDISHGPAKTSEELRSCLNIEKAKKKLGWEPSVDLKDGLKRTFESL